MTPTGQTSTIPLRLAGSLAWRAAINLLAGVAGFGVILFASAGTYRWQGAWSFLGLLTLSSTAIAVMLYRENPPLLEERMRPFNRPGQPLWDKIFLLVFWCIWVCWMVVMGLDAVRFRWTSMSIALQVGGGIGFTAANAGMYWICRVNSFLAPVVRLQPERGQTVVSTGPYAIVRHPMYVTAFLYVISMAMLLGSWIGCAAATLIIVALVYRTVREDEMLRQQLLGYVEYSRHVRYLLIPYLW